MHKNLQYLHCTYTDVFTVLVACSWNLTWLETTTSPLLGCLQQITGDCVLLPCFFTCQQHCTAATTQFLSAEESQRVGVGHFPARGALLVELLSSKFPHQQKAYYIFPQWHQMEPISLASTVSHYVEGSVFVGKFIANHNKVSLFIKTLKYSCNLFFGICPSPFQPLASVRLPIWFQALSPHSDGESLVVRGEKKVTREKEIELLKTVSFEVVWLKGGLQHLQLHILRPSSCTKWRLCNRMCNLQ